VVVLMGSLLLTVVGRVCWIPPPSRLVTESPQPLHHWCTVSTTCPHDVEVVLAAAALRCRAVSHTPTYDQLRGERINAAVPASEADPHQVDHPGKHRPRDDAPTAAAVGGSSPEPEADLAEDWSWLALIDSDQPGKHRLRDDAPGAPTVDSPPRGPAADLAKRWSCFGTGEPARAGPANATRSAHSSAGTHRHRQTPAADQQAGCGPQQLSEQAPYAPLPPPVHRRDRQQRRAVGTSRDAKPTAVNDDHLRTSKAPS